MTTVVTPSDSTVVVSPNEARVVVSSPQSTVAVVEQAISVVSVNDPGDQHVVSVGMVGPKGEMGRSVKITKSLTPPLNPAVGDIWLVG